MAQKQQQNSGQSSSSRKQQSGQTGTTGASQQSGETSRGGQQETPEQWLEENSLGDPDETGNTITGENEY